MAFNRKEHKEIPEEKIIEINAQMEGTLTFTDPVNLKIQAVIRASLIPAAL